MSRQVRFGRGVSPLAVDNPIRWRTPLRWQQAVIVTHLREYICLVEACPVPNSVPKLPEADIRVCCEVQPAFVKVSNPRFPCQPEGATIMKGNETGKSIREILHHLATYPSSIFIFQCLWVFRVVQHYMGLDPCSLNRGVIHHFQQSLGFINQKEELLIVLDYRG